MYLGYDPRIRLGSIFESVSLDLREIPSSGVVKLDNHLHTARLESTRTRQLRARKFPSTNSKEMSEEGVGHCLCGAVQFKVEGDPIYNVICHCENCKSVFT